MVGGLKRNYSGSPYDHYACNQRRGPNPPPPPPPRKSSCFYPNTLVTMDDGSHKRMKDVEIGNTLLHGSKVTGTLEIKGNVNNPYYKIGNILVSGTHKIKDKSGEFVYIMNYEGAEKTNQYSNKMSCLITDTHLIPIGGFIFWDWED